MEEGSFEGIEQRLRKVVMSGSSQSTLPAIYGQAVSQDTKRLRPLSHAVEVLTPHAAPSGQCLQL